MDYDLLSQDISKPWYNMHGECPFVFYVCVNKGQDPNKPTLNICICPIWEYHQMFEITYANPDLQKCIDYAWSGAILHSRWCDLKHDWDVFHENHKTFSQQRMRLSNVEMNPIEALANGIANIAKIKDCEKQLSSLRQFWMTPPKGFQSAVNWIAYDHDFFINNHSWPDSDSIFSIPRSGAY